MEDCRHLAVAELHALRRQLQEEVADELHPHPLPQAATVEAGGQVEHVCHPREDGEHDPRLPLDIFDARSPLEVVPGLLDPQIEHFVRRERVLVEHLPLATELPHRAVFVEDGHRLTFHELDERVGTALADQVAADDARVQPDLVIVDHDTLAERDVGADVHQARAGLLDLGTHEGVEHLLALELDHVPHRPADQAGLAGLVLHVDGAVLAVPVDPVTVEGHVGFPRTVLVGATVERQRDALLRDAEASDREAVRREVLLPVDGDLDSFLDGRVHCYLQC